MVRTDGDLQRADLVDHITVEADRVRRTGEQVDTLALHDERGHVVGDDGHVEAHVAADRRGQARALKIGPRLRAEEADVLARKLCFLQHHANDGLAEALGHNRPVRREEVDKVFCDLIDLAVAAVVRADHVLADREVDICPPLGQRGLCCVQAPVADEGHARTGRWAGVCDRPGGLMQICHLLCRRFPAALPRGEGHAHPCCRIRPGRLRDHVADGLHHGHMIATGDVFDLRGVDAAVEDVDGPVLVPRDVLVLQHVRQSGVGSCFHGHSSLRMDLR